MSDYISREAAIKLFNFAVLDCLGMEPTIRAGDIIKALESIPAADVRLVVRGRWIEDWETGCSECSVCHDGFLWEDFKGVADWKYCPSCGAEMREES